jgi:hypothetical protein
MNTEKEQPDPVVAVRFTERLPESRWFVFVDPEDPDRWVIGWKDWYHIREEGGSNYRHDDPRLTWWYPLPDVPTTAAE